MKKHFCTRCLKHFMKQSSLQQHAFYCTNEVEPDNLIDDYELLVGIPKKLEKQI